MSMSIEKECRKGGRDAVMEKVGPRCIAIIGVLRQHPGGLTAYEINRELMQNGTLHSSDLNTVKPRLTELRNAEVIEACGKRVTPSGCKTTVWRMKV